MEVERPSQTWPHDALASADVETVRVWVFGSAHTHELSLPSLPPSRSPKQADRKKKLFPSQLKKLFPTAPLPPSQEYTAIGLCTREGKCGGANATSTATGAEGAFALLGRMFVRALLQWRADPYIVHQANMVWGSFRSCGCLSVICTVRGWVR